MIFESLLGEIDAQINRLQDAKALLSGTATPSSKRKPGRPKSTETSVSLNRSANVSKPKRKMSRAARKRIADAQKKRWALVRKAAKFEQKA